jgi:hypothetical protein
MHFKKTVVAVVLGAALLVPSAAQASYNITQRQAEVYAADAAVDRYGDRWGVTAEGGADCRPQSNFGGSVYSFHPGRYHRWTCLWTGTDGDYADVYGWFRITGHNGYYDYGYLPVFGGLKWK